MPFPSQLPELTPLSLLLEPLPVQPVPLTQQSSAPLASPLPVQLTQQDKYPTCVTPPCPTCPTVQRANNLNRIAKIVNTPTYIAFIDPTTTNMLKCT